MNRPQRTGEISLVYSRATSLTAWLRYAQTANHYQTMVAFVAAQMKRGVDYGVIPGAEKFCRLFSLRPSYELIDSISDFEKPLFFYYYRCSLFRQGEMVGQGDGSCNSREKKYEAQKYKIYDLTNTICKIAQKRALVAAVLSSCGASAFFTQDIEEMGGVNR